MREQRKSDRVSFEVPVKVLVGSTSFEAKTKDISLGGMFIKSLHLPTIGSEVDLYFNIDKLGVKQRAYVRWVTKAGFGVQFNSMGVVLTHEINKVISQSKG